jgi:hypothetical protein
MDNQYWLARVETLIAARKLIADAVGGLLPVPAVPQFG